MKKVRKLVIFSLLLTNQPWMHGQGVPASEQPDDRQRRKQISPLKKEWRALKRSFTCWSKKGGLRNCSRAEKIHMMTAIVALLAIMIPPALAWHEAAKGGR